MRHIRILLCFTLLCFTLLAACEGGTKSNVARDLATPAPVVKPIDLASNPPVADGVLDNAKVLMVLHVANQGEVALAQVAQKRGTDKRVLDFAKMMLKDHAAADQKADQVGQSEKIVPTESSLSTHLEADGKLTMEGLQAVSAIDFDRTYIDAQVKGHEDVLGLLRNKLRPAATDPKLQSLIDAVMPTVQHHLDEAKKLQHTAGTTAVPK